MRNYLGNSLEINIRFKEIMIRLASVKDTEQLDILNRVFNGEDEKSLENIKNSLFNYLPSINFKALANFSSKSSGYQ